MSAAAKIVRLPEDGQGHFSSLLTESRVGLALCQSQGHITAFNPAFQQLLGSHSGLMHQSLAELIQAQDRVESQRLISELFEGRRESFQIDCQSSELKGQELRWTAWSVQGDAGKAHCVVVMVEDLAKLAITRQRLREAERLEAVGRLAGGVAHDFNNLLTGVLLYCDLLMAALEPGDRARKYAEEVRNASLQATGLVRQLLTLVRPVKSQPRLLSLNEIAEGMRNLLVRLIGENIELKLRLDPNLGLVTMDPSHAQQILLNLALNARDALPHGGRIQVETGNCKIKVFADHGRDNGGNTSLPCALFAVEDNGEGMDDSVRAHLFEPFFTTKGGRGTGLGLATVHDIVTTNGGLIHVQSESHRGTRISVLLPLVPDSAASSVHDTTFHPKGKGEVLPFLGEESTP